MKIIDIVFTWSGALSEFYIGNFFISFEMTEKQNKIAIPIAK